MLDGGRKQRTITYFSHHPNRDNKKKKVRTVPRTTLSKVLAKLKCVENLIGRCQQNNDSLFRRCSFIQRTMVPSLQVSPI